MRPNSGCAPSNTTACSKFLITTEFIALFCAVDTSSLRLFLTVRGNNSLSLRTLITMGLGTVTFLEPRPIQCFTAIYRRLPWQLWRLWVVISSHNETQIFATHIHAVHGAHFRTGDESFVSSTTASDSTRSSASAGIADPRHIGHRRRHRVINQMTDPASDPLQIRQSGQLLRQLPCSMQTKVCKGRSQIKPRTIETWCNLEKKRSQSVNFTSGWIVNTTVKYKHKLLPTCLNLIQL